MKVDHVEDLECQAQLVDQATEDKVDHLDHQGHQDQQDRLDLQEEKDLVDQQGN